MTEPGKIEVLFSNLSAYIQTNIKLIKLQLISKVAQIGSEIVGLIVMSMVLFLSLFFFSMGLCFYLSFRLNDPYSGFVIVGSFYLVLVLVLYLTRNALIIQPLRNIFITKMLNSVSDSDN
ncbi:MAG: phage holin family protein [bacterium]|nr:phage holin family protein [bacterium]